MYIHATVAEPVAPAILVINLEKTSKNGATFGCIDSITHLFTFHSANPRTLSPK